MRPFRNSILLKSWALPWFALTCLASTVSAQTLPTQPQTSVDGQRPKSTDIGFFELLEAGSNAFLELFERRESDPTPEDPRWNSLESPRHTVMTFLEAMNHVAFGRETAIDKALKTFAENGAANRRQAALDLLYVFDRLPELSAGTIPGPELIAEKNIRRFELFPRGIQHEWLYRALDDGPEGSIVLVADQAGNWTFDNATVTGAGNLLDSMKQIPPRRRLAERGNLFLNVIDPTIRKSTAADWLFFLAASLIGIATAYALSKLLTRIKGTRREGDDLLIAFLNGVFVPSYILIVTISIAVGSARLHFHPTLAELRSAIIAAAVVLTGIFLIVALIDLFCLGIRRSLFPNKDPYAKMVFTMIRRAVRIVAGIAILIFFLQNTLDWNVTALLGGFAIIALALSLASQDAVKNLFGAFTIFATRPFLSGDWVRFDGQIGEIFDVSLQATKIRLLTGEMYSVPNMKFIDNPVENLSERKYLRRVMNVAITYDTPVAKVREAIEILKEILRSEQVTGNGKGDVHSRPPKVWFDQFGSHYLNLRADYWYLMQTNEGEMQRDTERGWFSYLDHATMINQMVLERFNDADIDFAFPTQSLYLANDPDRGLKIEQEAPQQSFPS